MIPSRRLLGAIVTAIAIVWAEAAAGQGAFPNKPITVIVPFAAGGPTDVVARILSDHISRTLGQQLVVENIGGAGGTTGMTRVAQSAPDGYTIAVGNMGTQSAAPALYPNLKYDPATSFDQIGLAMNTPMVVIAKKDMAAKDFKEFVDYLKSNQSKVNFGHAGVGSVSYVVGTVFFAQVGIKPGLVAYRGTGPALNDLVGGQIDFMIDQALNNIPQIQAGTIKAYAVSSPQRLPSIPDVPTTKEAGMPEFAPNAWNAVVAPKGLPADVRAKLVDALSKALDDPDVVKRYAELGSTVPQGAERGPDALQKLVESEMARLTPALKAAAAAEGDAAAKK
jgi:tripartite-type tricarboxylate transporter receptor subunit TctC